MTMGRKVQNDKGRKVQNDRGREERFFASLRMTMGGECCHSKERISPSLSF